ncbi:MAG: hypothetical protein UH211_09610 [Agathobacter sp.]|nr:hypothetical protein [Agathobacter sp.]
MSSPDGLSFAPDQLTRFSGCPAIDTLLIHQFANSQCILFSGDSLVNVDIVDTARVPDSNVALPAQVTMEDSGYFFSGFDFDAFNTYLPSGFIFYDFAIPESQTAIVCDIADGANINSFVSLVSHIYNPLLYYFIVVVLYASTTARNMNPRVPTTRPQASKIFLPMSL